MVDVRKQMTTKPACKSCAYCRAFGWSTRLIAYECKHPDAQDGSCRAINLIGGRVDKNSAFADQPSIKTVPKWCPLKGDGKQ